MGANFFILSQELYDAYCIVYRAYCSAYEHLDELEDAIKDCSGALADDGKEALFDISMKIVDAPFSHHNHPDAIHIGRRTNGLFIWNIHPDRLRSLADGKCIVHENMFLGDCDTDNMTVDDFLRKQVGNATYDLENADKNTWFR